MECMKLFRQKNTLIINLLISLFFVLHGSFLQAQTTTDYSGKWAFDLANSNLGEGAKYWVGDEVLDITQDSLSIKIAKIFTRAGSADIKNAATYTLDGIEKITKEDFGTTKMSAKWSADNKMFTISTFITTTGGGITKDYLVMDTYKLADNAKTLIIESFSKNDATGERAITLVYRKK
jgi:hypothetical protein